MSVITKQKLLALSARSKTFEGFLRRSHRLLNRVRQLPTASEPGGPSEPSPSPPKPALKPFRKLLLLGTCQAYPLVLVAEELGYKTDHYLLGCNAHDDIGAAAFDWAGYEACVVSPVLRHVLHEASGQANELLFWRLDEAGIESLLDNCATYLEQKLAQLAEFMVGPTIVIGFLEPTLLHAGPQFRFDPALDFKEFVHDLNKRLKRLTQAYPSFWFLDPNPILDRIGRDNANDDVMAASTHAALLGDWDYEKDQQRIVKPILPTELFQVGPKPIDYARKVLGQISDLLEAMTSSEKIKLIILDLDDTLWRGIAAEDDFMLAVRREGWPFGMAEALLVFKRRGGVLAICSKNAHDETVARFKEIWGEVLTIEDFASVSITWNPKSEGVAGILADVNVLPEHTLFVDDNPREVEEVRAAFPAMKFADSNHYLWRQRILTSPDMMTARISAESANRTALIRAKIKRSESATGVSREEWLKSLDIRQSFARIDHGGHPHFDRAFELINKTNQFNTNGKRWTQPEMAALFEAGGYLLTSSLADRNADNGLTGVVIVRGNVIEQAVLSCRVFNLGAETGMLHEAVRLILAQHETAVGSVVETGRNFVCLDIYERLGFSRGGDVYATRQPPPFPPWIKLTGSQP
jgi:FkbH-like protein